MGTKTLLEICMDPALVEEYQSLEKQIAGMTEEIEKYNRTLGVYASKVKKGEKLPEDKMKQYQIAKKSVELFRENIENAEQRSQELRAEMDARSQGRIRVSDIAYPGVKILITGTNLVIRSEVRRTQFLKDRSVIKAALL